MISESMENKTGDLLNNLVIQGDRIVLEKLLKHATPTFLADNLNDEATSRYMLFLPFPYTEADGESFINFLNHAERTHEAVEMAVLDKKTGELLGVTSFAHLDMDNMNAEVGYWFRGGKRGQGYAREAVKILTSFGFEQLGLERIYAYVVKENMPSIKVLEAVGFKREGVLRKAAKHRGNYVDRCVYSILRGELK